jgi:hypothetical protein
MAFRFAAERRHMAEARTHGAGRPNKLAERSLATSPRDSHGAGWSPPRRLDRHGLRASQLCSLRLEQVDLVHARLHVSVPKITFCNNGTGSAKSPQSILEFLSILNAMDSDFHLAVRSLSCRPQKNSGPPTDAGATNFVRSTHAHSGLQCPELAQLRPQIVPWSTLCRADWVRNDPVLTTRG